MIKKQEKPYTGRDISDGLLGCIGMACIIVGVFFAISLIAPPRWEAAPTTAPMQTLPPVVVMAASEVTPAAEECSAVDAPELQSASYSMLAAATNAEPAPTAKPEPVMISLGKFKIVGYDPYCSHCVGKTIPNGVTASGAIAEVGRTVAMADVAFGTRIYIDGLGEFVVEDRGVNAGMVDVACDGHDACYAITSSREVWLVEDAS